MARPNTLGVQAYGPDVKTLGLCPPTPNCISTAEEMNDPGHYVAPWTYNPQVCLWGGRGQAGGQGGLADRHRQWGPSCPRVHLPTCPTHLTHTHVPVCSKKIY